MPRSANVASAATDRRARDFARPPGMAEYVVTSYYIFHKPTISSRPAKALARHNHTDRQAAPLTPISK